MASLLTTAAAAVVAVVAAVLTALAAALAAAAVVEAAAAAVAAAAVVVEAAERPSLAVATASMIDAPPSVAKNCRVPITATKSYSVRPTSAATIMK
jgi:hypothetical protein